MKTVWIPIAFAVFLCCAKNTPSRLDGKEKRLAAAYAELIHMAAQISTQAPAYQDSAAAVLKRLHFTKEDYDRSVASLNKNPERWELFYREVQSLLRTNKSSATAPP